MTIFSYHDRTSLVNCYLLVYTGIVIYWELRWGITHPRPGGRGVTLHENDRDACRKIRIKPLKETNLGVAQLYLTSKEDLTLYGGICYFYLGIFFWANTK